MAVQSLSSILIGGGNVGTNGDTSNSTLVMLNILQSINATACRTNLYPGSYIDNNNWSMPTPAVLDGFMLAAYARNITPMVLLEYYPNFYPSVGFGTPQQWQGIGAAFAEYLQPGGGWAVKYGIRNFGVSVYSAVNEPDGQANFTVNGTVPGPDAYVAALAGLSAGVKSVNPALKVAPGGFMSANAFDDWTLRGLGPRLAPLWNSGALDALDLHTYFDIQYAPMEGTHGHSAQANVDAIRAACGITSPTLAFHATEYNYKERLVNETYAAAGLLTAVWDALGVVGADGAPATALAFPWNIFNTNASDLDYGMAVTDAPYVPTQRGVTFALVTRMLAARAWQWVSADPRSAGVFVLAASAGDATLTVWQNRDGWTSMQPLRDVFNVTQLPLGATQVQYYGFDGLRQVVPVSPGTAWVVVAGVAVNETAMFLATS